jgi:hypothetical protein
LQFLHEAFRVEPLLARVLEEQVVQFKQGMLTKYMPPAVGEGEQWLDARRSVSQNADRAGGRDRPVGGVPHASSLSGVDAVLPIPEYATRLGQLLRGEQSFLGDEPHQLLCQGHGPMAGIGNAQQDEQFSKSHHSQPDFTLGQDDPGGLRRWPTPHFDDANQEADGKQAEWRNFYARDLPSRAISQALSMVGVCGSISFVST